MNMFVESFKKENYPDLKMPLVTVYYNPSDFPGKYVARLFDFENPTNQVMVKDTLDEIRDSFVSQNYSSNTWVNFSRDELDDPNILEIWI